MDWDLDGVDFYNMDVSYSASWSGTYQDPGTSATYAMAVLMHLRRLVGNTKTISYSTISYGVFDCALSDHLPVFCHRLQGGNL